MESDWIYVDEPGGPPFLNGWRNMTIEEGWFYFGSPASIICPHCSSDDVRELIRPDPTTWHYVTYRCAVCEEEWTR